MATIIKAQGTETITATGTLLALNGGTQLLIINDGPDPVQYQIDSGAAATKTFSLTDFTLNSGESEVTDIRSGGSMFAICEAAKTCSIRYKCVDAGGSRR